MWHNSFLSVLLILFVQITVSSVLASEIDTPTFGERILSDFQSFSIDSSCPYTVWEPDLRLTIDDGVSTTGMNNALNIASGPSDNVHVVWMDNRDISPYSEIYYKRSTDGGVVWSTDTRLTNDPAWSAHPGIAITASKVHVVWMDSRNGAMNIYYKYSSDQGINWSSDICLSYHPDLSKEFPSIAATGNVVHVVWEEQLMGNMEIFYKRSADGGISWSEGTYLTSAPDSSTHASVCVSGSLVSVVWYDYRDGGNPEIYYKRSTNGGINWSADTRLTNNTHYSYCPSVSSSGNNVHVVWHDDRNGISDIYYKRSTNGGSNWSADTRLTFFPSNESAIPSVAASGDNIHLVWYDTRDGNLEIYYKRSTDSGLHWETDTRLTDAPDSSACASVSFGGTRVHVVWTDLRDGNYEIYYKRNPTGNTGVGIEEGEGLPFTAILHPPLPNPFSSSLSITYSLPKPSQVELSVYDLAGRLIDTLANGPVSTGEHTTVWNPDPSLSIGCYLIVLNADGDRLVRRCVKLE